MEDENILGLLRRLVIGKSQPNYPAFYSGAGPNVLNRSRAMDGLLFACRQAMMMFRRQSHTKRKTEISPPAPFGYRRPRWGTEAGISQSSHSLSNANHELQREVSVLAAYHSYDSLRSFSASAINLAGVRTWAFQEFAGTLHRQGEQSPSRYRASSVAPER